MKAAGTFVQTRVRTFALPVFLFVSQTLFADGDVSEALFDHVLNGRKLDLFPFVPEITLPFGMTMHQFMLLLAVSLIIFLYMMFSLKETFKPGKFQIGLEALVLYVRDEIVYPVMGEEKGRKWISFFSSLFIFLLTVNLLGLIPALKTATGNINVTAAMALIVLVLTFAVGFREIGLIKFFKNLFPEGTALPVGLFVAFLEFISIFTKSMVLALRLFANMFAGHLAILSFLVLLFIISPLFGFVSVPFALFTYVLEVLIGLLQALVFTLLSCIFISMASSH